MEISFHHTHFVTNDVEKFCDFFINNFNAVKIYDEVIDRDRNIFIKIGSGRIHLFESKRKLEKNKTVFHHIGMMVENIEVMAEQLKKNRIFVSKIVNVSGGKFAITKGPDNLKIELFEVSEESRKFFVD
ncbi:MAG: VOC family protein [Leptospiraceae bacterium]|nr:VOC family protein [Leptospiraceae bacterium]